MRFLFIPMLLLLSLTSFSQAINPLKLDSLVAQAKNAHSDGLIVMQNGKIVVEEYFNQPLTPTYIASVGKALVGVALIKLLNDGKIKSIDQPIADFYPEWRQGQKKLITLRMIMSHTSGLQNERNTRLEIETGPNGAGNDLVKLALAAELSDKPSTVYSYNNKAICLLPGIIEQASGKRMDAYFEEQFFKPMNITHFEWKRDSTGRPQGHAGFVMLPRDLAKFGQLMLDKGVFNGRRYFEERWVDSAIKSSQEINKEIGLIWHRYSKRISSSVILDEEQLQLLRKKGIADSLLSKLRPLMNQTFTSKMELSAVAEKSLGPQWLKQLGEIAKGLPNDIMDLFRIKQIDSPLNGYYHSGSWGNYFVIIPHLKLVVVRVVKRDKEYKQDADLFGNFVNKVFSLEDN